ncbi:MAG: JAB domain-containing protein [Bdellovibrionaceae bacterium]|nr:JAB domain-containing protein [Pseudobdellovibrionaceae bacterium]
MVIDTSRAAWNLLRDKVRLDVEEVWVIGLDSALQALGVEMLFRGTANRCLAHPRDIFRTVIRWNSISFILAHSHPSGNLMPSDEDIRFTRQLAKGAALLGLEVEDHLIICQNGYYSFRDSGISFRAHRRGVLAGFL